MTEAVRRELHIEEGDPDYPILTLWSRKDTQAGFTLLGTHTFTDPSDGEIFTLNPGDRLEVWRD
jgi:hypothetical protein